MVKGHEKVAQAAREALTEKQDEILGDIHNQAAEIQRNVVLCLSNNRLGATWIRNLNDHVDRLTMLMERLGRS